MKSVRVLVPLLLLLAFVRVFTAEDPDPNKDPNNAPPNDSVSAVTTARPVAPSSEGATSATTSAPSTAPGSNKTAVRANDTSDNTTATSETVATQSPQSANATEPTATTPSQTNATSNDSSTKLPATTSAPGSPKTAQASVSTTVVTNTTAATGSTVVITHSTSSTNHTSTSNSSLQHETGPHSGSPTSSSGTKKPDGQDESTKGQTKATPGIHSANATQESPKSNSNLNAGKADSTEKPKDKKLWWIALPVGLIAAAAATICLKFKGKKVHDPTETIDIGTENASFQSRPESTKDGVMLLGVKSSGGDENAAAR